MKKIVCLELVEGWEVFFMRERMKQLISEIGIYSLLFSVGWFRCALSIDLLSAYRNPSAKEIRYLT